MDVHPVKYVLAQRERKRIAKSIYVLGGRLFRNKVSVFRPLVFSNTISFPFYFFVLDYLGLGIIAHSQYQAHISQPSRSPSRSS